MFRFLVLMVLAAPAFAQTGGEIYKERCSLCHDSGATQAPRLGMAADWKLRVGKGRPALLRAAIHGIPGTAMTAKGGHTDLADADVTAAVDFMLSTLEIVVSSYSEPPRLKPAPAKAASVARVDDRTLVARVNEAIQARRIRGVTVEAKNGLVVLRGTLDDAAAVKLAEQTARAVAGVASLDSKLISADIFEHD